MMYLVTIFGIAFALACDAFSVGLAIGTKSPTARGVFRLWFHFGLFQFLMPLLGWCLGSALADTIGAAGQWVASVLLFFIAFKMWCESRECCDATEERDQTRGLSLLILSFATSIDALGVGVGMGIAGESILYPAFIIGVVAAVMTYAGVRLGYKLSTLFGKRVEVLGATVLFIIALKLLPIW